MNFNQLENFGFVALFASVVYASLILIYYERPNPYHFKLLAALIFAACLVQGFTRYKLQQYKTGKINELVKSMMETKK